MGAQSKTTLAEIEVAATVYYNLNVHCTYVGWTDTDELQYVCTSKYFVDPADGADGLKDVCRAIFNSMRRGGVNPHSVLKEKNLRSMKVGDVVQFRYEDGIDTFALFRNGWRRISLSTD